MSLSRYLTLYEYNWLPAMYSHVSQLGVWGQHLIGSVGAQSIRREPDDRLMHRMSQEMMRGQDSFEPLDRVPDSVWPFAQNSWIQQVAFEMGLAALAGKARSSIDRKSVLELMSVVGSGARKRSLSYLERFPVLGACVPANFPIHSRDHVVGLGGQVLCEAIDRQTVFGDTQQHPSKSDAIIDGVKHRLALRFPRHDSEVEFSESAGIEIRTLLAEICNGKLRESANDHVACELSLTATGERQ